MPLTFKEPHIIRASYRIVTPMFIGDAQQKASGISPASVKGALRFWWRALMWANVYKLSGQSETAALKLLNEQESELFGTSNVDSKDPVPGSSLPKKGAARFTVRVQHESLKFTDIRVEHPKFKDYPAARYLAYGLMEAFSSRPNDTQAGQLWRECINEGQTFNVVITSKDPIDENLKRSLILMGLLGGLGSRVRRGMGSLVLESLILDKEKIWEVPSTIDEYTKIVSQTLAGAGAASFPPFSAFSERTSIDILERSETPYESLNSLGTGMMMYRSWGNKGNVLHRDREENFKADHDWKYGNADADFHPRRVIFGLPHNYGKGERFAVTPEKGKPRSEYSHDRRGSPLFFHIHKIGSEYVGVSLLLEAKFLPDGERINAGGKNVPAKIEWSVLRDLIRGSDKQGNKRFPNRINIMTGSTSS